MSVIDKFKKFLSKNKDEALDDDDDLDTTVFYENDLSSDEEIGEASEADLAFDQEDLEEYEYTDEDLEEEEEALTQEMPAPETLEEDTLLSEIPDLPNVDTGLDSSITQAKINEDAVEESAIYPKESTLSEFNAEEILEPTLSQKLTKPFSSIGKKLKPKTSSNSYESGSLPAKYTLANFAKKVNLEKLIGVLYAPQSRKNIHRLFIFSVVGIVTYSVGKNAALMFTPKKQPPRASAASTFVHTPSKIESIKRNNLFDAKGSLLERVVKKPVVDLNKKCLSASIKSSLPLELHNTIVLQDSVKSIASVSIRNKKEFLSIRVGDDIERLAEVGSIESEKLIIKNLKSGQCEFIQNKDRPRKSKSFNVVSPSKGNKILAKQSRTGIKNEGNKFKIKKSYRDEVLGNIGDVLSQARAVQIKNPDGSLCFKMTEIEPDSVYSKLDIVDEDIICSINGKKFSNLGDVMSLFNKITEIDNFELSVKRNGLESVKEYSFE